MHRRLHKHHKREKGKKHGKECITHRVYNRKKDLKEVAGYKERFSAAELCRVCSRKQEWRPGVCAEAILGAAV